MMTIREVNLHDEVAFLDAIQKSKTLHHPWVNPPLTPEECIETVVRRYQDPNYVKNDFWKTSDFECHQLSEDIYLLTYILIQGKEKRITRRSTIWKNRHGQWVIVYHQGTVVDGKKVDQS